MPSQATLQRRQAAERNTEKVGTILAELTDDTAKQKKVNWTNRDVDIEHDGSKMILPAKPSPMSLDAGIELLTRRKAEEAKKYDVQEFIPGAFWDAAYAFYRAMQRTYGWVDTRSMMTMFGEKKPSLVTLKIGPKVDDVVQFPMGEFHIPGIENPVRTILHKKDGVPGMYVMGQVRRREQAFLVELAITARQILQEESIYRGYAISLTVNDGGEIVFEHEPEFLDLETVKETDLIFGHATQRLIETTLFTPLKKTDLCRRMGVPLKRGILLEGPYGGGKSLTARVAAKVASDNDWTFLMLDKPQGLEEALNFARLYQPCVVFCEDIDRMGVDRENDDDVNTLVNILDGVKTKNVEIITVLTTNFVEKIDKALLRPGRFDAVLRIDPPDADAVRRLIHHYAGNMVEPGADLSQVMYILDGQIPATIREVVERAKMDMILDERDLITADDLTVQATGMQRHLALLNDVGSEPSDAEKLADALRAVINPANSSNLANEVEEAGQYARNAATHAIRSRQASENVEKALGGVKVDTEVLREQAAGLRLQAEGIVMATSAIAGAAGDTQQRVKRIEATVKSIADNQ